jgi:hypothetical protein
MAINIFYMRFLWALGTEPVNRSYSPADWFYPHTYWTIFSFSTTFRAALWQVCVAQAFAISFLTVTEQSFMCRLCKPVLKL